jgi:hypothetical protein
MAAHSCAFHQCDSSGTSCHWHSMGRACSEDSIGLHNRRQQGQLLPGTIVVTMQCLPELLYRVGLVHVVQRGCFSPICA